MIDKLWYFFIPNYIIVIDIVSCFPHYLQEESCSNILNIHFRQKRYWLIFILQINANYLEQFNSKLNIKVSLKVIGLFKKKKLCYSVIGLLEQYQPQLSPLKCAFLWLLTAQTAPLKPFTDSSLSWNLLPYPARTAEPRKLPRGRLYGSQLMLIGWWIQKVKGGKVTPLALAVTASELPLSAGRQTTTSEQNVTAPPQNPPTLHPWVSCVGIHSW